MNSIILHNFFEREFNNDFLLSYLVNNFFSNYLYETIFSITEFCNSDAMKEVATFTTLTIVCYRNCYFNNIHFSFKYCIKKKIQSRTFIILSTSFATYNCPVSLPTTKLHSTEFLLGSIFNIPFNY